VSGLTPAAAAALERYGWPGNVRELQHAMERAVILTPAETVDVADLPEAIRSGSGASPGGVGAAPAGGGTVVIPLGTPLEEVERIVIRRTLEQTKGDKNLAAQILGIAARTIYRKLERDEEGRLLGENDPAE
jgi:two-component system response regulator HydG